MPAAFAVSDRVTLDVRGAVLNCQQPTFGVSLPRPTVPFPAPYRGVTSEWRKCWEHRISGITRFTRIECHFIFVHARGWAEEWDGGWCWRRWKISKNCRNRCSKTTLKKCRAHRPSDAKNLVTTIDRRHWELPRSGLPSLLKFRVNISRQGAKVSEENWKQPSRRVLSSCILSSRLYLYTILTNLS